MIKPQPMSFDELVSLLRHITNSVERGDSLEGSVEYLLPSEADGEQPPSVAFMVTAGFRVGNLRGQGGFTQIGTYTDEPTPEQEMSGALNRVLKLHVAETVEVPCPSRDCCAGPHEVTVCAECGSDVEGQACATVRAILGEDADQPEAVSDVH